MEAGTVGGGNHDGTASEAATAPGAETVRLKSILLSANKSHVKYGKSFKGRTKCKIAESGSGAPRQRPHAAKRDEKKEERRGDMWKIARDPDSFRIVPDSRRHRIQEGGEEEEEEQEEEAEIEQEEEKAEAFVKKSIVKSENV